MVSNSGSRSTIHRTLRPLSRAVGPLLAGLNRKWQTSMRLDEGLPLSIDVQKKNRESRFGAHRFAVVAHEGQDLVR